MIGKILILLLLQIPHSAWPMIQTTVRIDGKLIKKDGEIVSVETNKGIVLVPAAAVDGRPFESDESVALFVDLFDLVKLNPKIFPKPTQ